MIQIGRVVSVLLMLLAVVPAGVAIAAESTLAITSPENGSSSPVPTPSFSGTTNGTQNPVSLQIHVGDESGSILHEEAIQPPFSGIEEDEWGSLGWLLGPGTYTAVATEQNPAETFDHATSTFTIEEPPPVEVEPVVTENPTNKTVQAGHAATFTAAASGTPEPEVQWEVSTDSGATFSADTSDSGNRSDTLTIGGATVAQNGWEYRAEFSNGAGNATSAAATLTVEEPPAITKNPSNTGAQVGESASFTAEASGFPTPTVQWEVSTNFGSTWASDTSDSGNNTDTLTVAVGSLEQNGNEYRARFANAAGVATSNSATLSVKSGVEKPTVTLNPANRTVPVGTAASFKAEASGVPAPTVQWEVSSDGGENFGPDTTDPGNTTDTLTVTPTSVASSGNEYRAVFKNGSGTATSAAATLTVTQPPVITENPTSRNVNQGEAVSFTAEASGEPAPTVQWEVSTGGGSFTNDTSDPGNKTDTLTITSATLGQTGNRYRAVFTNKFGAATTTAATLTVERRQERPVVTRNPSSTSVVVGEQSSAKASFTAEASGFPTPGVQWQISTNEGATWTNDTTDSGNNTETLTVTATTVEESGDEYRAVFKNAAGQAESAPATLIVNESPRVVVNPTDVGVRAGERATFTAAASATPAPTVQWQVSTNGGSSFSNDTTDPGNTTETLTIAAATLGQNHNQYRAVFKNKFGSATSKQATLSVSEKAVPPFVPREGQPEDDTVLAGQAATFTAKAQGSPTPAVQWQVSTDKGSTWANLANNKETLTIPGATLGQSGNKYRAVFTNEAGEAISNPATLTVQAAAAVVSSPGDQRVVAGEAATFTATGSGTPTPKVQWEVSTGGGKFKPDTTDKSKETQNAGSTVATLTVTATLAESGNQYRAVFTNQTNVGVGQQPPETQKAASQPATLTVVAEPEAPVITTQPANQSVSPGGSAAFTAAAQGAPAPTVQWQLSTDGGSSWSALSGETSDTFTVVNATSSENGFQYRAMFTNKAGTRFSNAATLTVTTPPTGTVRPPGPPVASFTVFPASPHTGEKVSLVSSSTDPESAITGFQWALAGNGVFGPAGPVVTTSFATPGPHVVGLRVLDANGLSSTATKTITVTPPPAVLMAPFPIVRLAGSDSSRGVKLRLLSVQAPLGARITITCRGHGCPVKSLTRVAVLPKPKPKRKGKPTAKKSTAATVVVQFPRFQRFLRAGVVLEIRVWKAGMVGKYTRFTIRPHRLPIRVDECLNPANSKPMTCP